MAPRHLANPTRCGDYANSATNNSATLPCACSGSRSSRRGNPTRSRCSSPSGARLMPKTPEQIADELLAKAGVRTKPNGPQAGTTDVTLEWERMSDIEPEAVDWIWPGRIARGKLTLIAGDPGMGKSQIALDVVARITRARIFPDPDKSSAPLGSVLILTAEDAAKDTVRPRLEGVDADLSRVHRLKSAITKDGKATTFRLQADLALLAAKLRAVGDVTLVIIDPITSYMGSKIDSHHVTDVRAVLEPLAAWAEQHHVA